MVDERVFERTPTWWWTVAGIVVLSGTLYLTLAQTPGTIVQEQIAVRQIWLIVTQGPFLAWAAAVALRHREGTARALRLAPILVLLALAAVASAAWSINPPRTLLESLRLVGVSLFAVALCTRLEQKERHLAFAVSLSIALGISFAMVLLCPSMAVTVASEHEAGAWLGAHGHKNSLAAVCAMALLTLLPLLWKAPKRWGGPTLMAAFMLIMTRSYTAVGTLGCVAAFAANAHLSHRYRKRPLLAWAPWVLTVLVGLVAWTWRAELLTLVNRDPSLTGRTRQWAKMFPFIFEHPWLGYGYGTFWREELAQPVRIVGSIDTYYGHNGYIETALGLGAIAVVLLVIQVARTLHVSAIAWLKHERSAWPFLIASYAAVHNVAEGSFLLNFGVNGLLWIMFLCATLETHAGDRDELARRV